MEKSVSVFESKSTFAAENESVNATELYAKIGELQMERDFLKKVYTSWRYYRSSVTD